MDHILVVEDSETQALRMRHFLEGAGYEVECAHSAEAALEKLNRRLPDLVVTDFNLPGVTGDELCRRIRMNVNTRGIPILMLTSEDAEHAEQHGLESGTDDFVRKSDDYDVLLLRIQALLRKFHVPDAVAGDVRFTKARLLAVDDSPTYLQYIAAHLRQEGYEVETAVNGAAALERLALEEFDGVVLDLILPDMSGADVCRRLVEARRTSEQPFVILALTGQKSKENIVEVLAAGADDVVAKSREIGLIMARLRALLRRKLLYEENQRIIAEFQDRELAVVRARAEKEAAEERAALAGQLEKSNRELEAANKELESFSYSISHDLRAPLRAINGFARILVEDYSPQIPAEAQRLLNIVTTNAQRMEQLIEDLLRFSRLGRQVLAKQPVKISTLVQDVLDELRKIEENRSIEIQVGALPDCRADLSLLKQVFVNLLSNAFKFTRKMEHPAVEVGCREEDGEKVYFVRDNGAGFDMRYAAKLFGVFQRLHRSDEFEGTGVGLSIVQRIVQRHGGRIWAEAEVGKGATFHFTLPA